MDNHFSNILNIFKRLDESALNELDTLAPRTVYFKMPDGNYLKADYRGTQGIFGGGHASEDGVSFTSMSWVAPQTAKTLGLEKFLAAQGGSIAQKGGTDVAIVGQRSMDVVDFTKGGDSVPTALKTKVVQWVEKNPAPAASNVPPSQQVAQNQQAQATREGSMTDAEKHSTGPEFTGYWKGTDSDTPGNKMVGASEDAPTKHKVSVTISEPDSQAVSQRSTPRQRMCSVTAPDRETAVNTAIRWYRKQGYKVLDHNYIGPIESLKEFGADNNTAPTNAADQAAKTKELQQVTQAITKAKGAGVIPSNISPTAGAQAVASDVTDINKANMMQKKEMGAVADSFNDFMQATATQPGGQAALNQVLQTMKRVKTASGPTGGGG